MNGLRSVLPARDCGNTDRTHTLSIRRSMLPNPYKNKLTNVQNGEEWK